MHAPEVLVLSGYTAVITFLDRHLKGTARSTFNSASLTNLRDHLLPGLWPLLAAFVVCAVVVPLMIWLSRRTGLIAEPGGPREEDREGTSRSAGL